MGAAPSANDEKPVQSADDLLAPLWDACKPPAEFRIGAEAEKIGVFEPSLAPIHYAGVEQTLGTALAEPGVLSVMNELVHTHGWARVEDGGPLLALEREGASVTLEPGAQLELSGAPHADLHAVAAEFERHRLELHEVADALEANGQKMTWLGIGFHPFASQAQLSWVPKPRYFVMRRFLPARGAHGLEMMRRTATVQANYDYEHELHAMRTLQVGLRLAPFFTAQFANSPLYEGKLFGGVSYRAKVWLSVEPDRQGLVPPVWKKDAGFWDYIQWALDAPMFLLLRKGEVVENTGQSFRSFMRYGFGEHRPTMSDWVTHLNTLFPEVRLKRTLEIRGGDSLPRDLVTAPAALFTGLYYDPRALDAVEALTESFTLEEVTALRERVWRDGPRAEFRGRPCGEVMQSVVDIARGGLERRARASGEHRDERVHLAPLTQLASDLRCPADELIAEVQKGADIAQATLRICRL